jgi:hypothetical protein
MGWLEHLTSKHEALSSNPPVLPRNKEIKYIHTVQDVKCSRVLWLKPVILAPQEIGRMEVQASPGKEKVLENSISTNGWVH